MHEEIEEAEAKKLLSRIAKFVGLELIESSRDARMDRQFFCFSNGKARFSDNYFSLRKMLWVMLRLREFSAYPGIWATKVGEKIQYINPFYGMSLEELKIKLDLEEEIAKKKDRTDD